ncbi:hypothetical protein CCO03_05625 [Comamonas serinivorans]|uniref:DUF2269 domain-containing protein n=1 Tax=Comamonas serinivorans TaxID=1082851 RepID=A0A1Y0EKY6_9BURK|nr:DUF2269 domain-containing protein [Comamonas serinivorans]ARU04226.1 hypothetical protein CCO03_05625 [Comamonas serinivorans]
MTTYLLLKTLHILSSVLLVGTGFGSAFYLFFANRSHSVAAQATVARLVVRADTWFTAPAGVVQLASGVALAHWAGWPLSTPWLTLALALYAVAGLCWLPVVVMQIEMQRIAALAVIDGRGELPPRYWQLARRWEALGYPAFVAMLAIYGLMVMKPTLWG